MRHTDPPPVAPPVIDLPPIDGEQAAFLEGPVAINLASLSATLSPSIARGYGCRVSPDRRGLTIYLSVPRARSLLRDLEAGAPVAAVLSRPMNHKSLQIKGSRASIRPLEPGERELMRAYGRSFAAEVEALGYRSDFTSRLVEAVEDEAVAVSLAIGAVFEQTPGPRAGQRLGPGS